MFQRQRFSVVLAVCLLGLVYVPTRANACDISAEYADPCDSLDQGGSYSGGGPQECRRCVIGDDGSVSCRDRSAYQSRWPEYYPCTVVTHCYDDPLQGRYCEVGCDGTQCYSV
jgi:hypothetical protein